MNQQWAGSVGSLVRKWNPAHDNKSSPLFAWGVACNSSEASRAVWRVDSTSGELRTLRDSGASVPQPPDTLRLVLISDTHEQHGKLDMPPGDVLVHTGDLLLFNSRYRRTTSMDKLSEFNR